MSGRWGPSLADRSRAAPVPSPAPAPDSRQGGAPALTGRPDGQDADLARPRPVTQRHCWVTGLPDHPGRWAGLLAEWRHAHSGWEGRVTVAVTRDGRCVLVEAWLAAAQLEPAGRRSRE